jgi:hypothetical protein
MGPFLTKAASWWDSLGESDRRTLKLASPVILFLFIYLVLVQPVLSHYLEVKSQRQQLQDSLVWMYENAALVNRMQNACSLERPVARGNDMLSVYVQNIGRRASTEINIRVINTRELDITADGLAGARALGLAQSLICAGFEISNLRVARDSAEAAGVDMSARLSAAPFLVNSPGATQ